MNQTWRQPAKTARALQSRLAWGHACGGHSRPSCNHHGVHKASDPWHTQLEAAHVWILKPLCQPTYRYVPPPLWGPCRLRYQRKMQLEALAQASACLRSSLEGLKTNLTAGGELAAAFSQALRKQASECWPPLELPFLVTISLWV